MPVFVIELAATQFASLCPRGHLKQKLHSETNWQNNKSSWNVEWINQFWQPEKQSHIWTKKYPTMGRIHECMILSVLLIWYWSRINQNELQLHSDHIHIHHHTSDHLVKSLGWIYITRAFLHLTLLLIYITHQS